MRPSLVVSLDTKTGDSSWLSTHNKSIVDSHHWWTVRDYMVTLGDREARRCRAHSHDSVAMI